MSIASEPKRCPKCGGPIPAEAPQGLCPRCLLLQASMPTEAGQGETSKPQPPTQAELAAAFPQLEILELIGQGGMGFVFKARQPKLERLVALKILPQTLAADPAFAERFTREGRVLARLNHPNIVTIHDFGQSNGFFYLLMEFVDGVNLRQAMKVGRFTPAQALSVVPKICEALQFAHNEGILHRDIKPENILLDSKGRVKIADFGIAKLIAMETEALNPSHSPAEGRPPEGNLTETGKTLGTPNYMAPEQLEHPQDVDQRADIYSLGVVFYEMLTGELPIGRFAPPSEKSAVDPRMDEVVLRTLEKERERRTQTAGEVKTQVETIAATGSAATGGAFAAAPLNQAKPGMGKHLLRGAMAGFLVFFLTVFAAALVAFLLPESYRASARIKLDAAPPSVLPAEQSSDPYRPGQYFDPYLLQAEFETIRSEPVLGRVIERLNLQQRWGQRYGVQPKLPLVEAVELLKRGLEIRPVRNTMVIEIGYFSEFPSEAAELANAIVESYALYHVEQIRAFVQERKERATDSGALTVPPRLIRVEVLDRAMPPLRPIRPNKPLNIALGIGVGVVLGFFAGLVVALASLWTSRVSVRRAATLSAPKPDRFWRWFAVVVLAMIAIPIGIAVLGILAAIAIPNFVKARERAQHQHEMARDSEFSAQVSGRTHDQQSLGAPQSSTGSTPVFGPVLDRVINDVETGTNYLIDLDTGIISSLPPSIKFEDVLATEGWYVQVGVDVSGRTKGWQSLRGCNLISQLVRADRWDNLTASELERFLELCKTSYAFPGSSLGNNIGTDLPTFLFKTREGGVGLLQITGFAENPRGVKIRYKLLQTAKPQPEKQ